MQISKKWVISIFVILFLVGCAQQPLTGTGTPAEQAQLRVSPTSKTPSREVTSAPTSIYLDMYAASDLFGDAYVSLLPAADLDGLPGEEIARQLILQWLDHYKNDCQDPYYQLDSFSLNTVTAENGSQGFEWIVLTQFDILPSQPLTSDYAGETQPNGWIGLQGEILPDGTMKQGGVWGVFRDGDSYRLRMLIGWGT